MARLSSVELDIFLTSASPDQRAIVRTLRDIITSRATELTERVGASKPLTGYLLYEGPGGQLVFAIGLTGARTVTLQPAAYFGSRDLRDRHQAALGPFQAGKDGLRFGDPAELPVAAIAAVADATPGFLGQAAAKAPPRRWGRRAAGR